MNGADSKKRLILLFLRAQAGDREAVDQLLETFQNELFSYLEKLLSTCTDSEEILQTALIQAVTKIKWLREPEYFRPWIYRIASRNAYRVIKVCKRRKEYSNAGFIDTSAQTDVVVSDNRPFMCIATIPVFQAESNGIDRQSPGQRNAKLPAPFPVGSPAID